MLSLALWMRVSPWFMDDFDGNAFASHSHAKLDAHVSAMSLESIEVYQPGVEHHSTIGRGCKVSDSRGVAKILNATIGGRDQ
jgi:hypothetical protein